MRRSFWLRESDPQGGPSSGADSQQASQPDPIGPYCLLPAPGASQSTPARPAPANASAPTLAWSRSHGDP